MAKKRKVANLMALAVLATVVQRPMHRYEMASVMRARGKDRDMDIKWGSLYTVVQNLEKNGFLHVDEIVLPGVEAPRRGRGGSGRESRQITDMLKPGQEIVVQVVKDPLKSKGARLSMELTIAGRYMVYAPTGEGIGVSRRLDDKERDRLRKEAKQLDLGGGGAIIRTAAQGAKREDFERELQ